MKDELQTRRQKKCAESQLGHDWREGIKILVCKNCGLKVNR